MTRTLSAVLITLGDPGRLTGGYLFHRRLAELAPAHAARLEFVSFPHRPFPLAILDARRVIAAAARHAPDVLVIDSIAAAFLGPALLLRPPPVPLVGMLHQPPGGIDHGPLRSRAQAVLDRLAYRRAARLLPNSSEASASRPSASGSCRRAATSPPRLDHRPETCVEAGAPPFCASATG